MVVQVKSRLVEGTEVLVETSRQGARQGKEEGVRLAAEVGVLVLGTLVLPWWWWMLVTVVQVQHTDWVTDLALCETTQPLLVTASNDGCIKVIEGTVWWLHVTWLHLRCGSDILEDCLL